MLKFLNKPNLSTISTVIRTNINNHKPVLSTTTFHVNQYVLRHNPLPSFLKQTVNNKSINMKRVVPLYSVTIRKFTANTADNTKKTKTNKYTLSDRVFNWTIAAFIIGIIIANLIVLWRNKRIQYLNYKLNNMEGPIYDLERLKLQLELIIRYFNMGQDRNAAYIIAELVEKVDPKYIHPTLYTQFNTIITYNSYRSIQPLLNYYIQARKLTEPTRETLNFIWDLEDKAERMINKLWGFDEFNLLDNCSEMKNLLCGNLCIHSLNVCREFAKSGYIYTPVLVYERVKRDITALENAGYKVNCRIILEMEQLQQAIVELDKKIQAKLDKVDVDSMNKTNYHNLLINFILLLETMRNILM